MTLGKRQENKFCVIFLFPVSRFNFIESFWRSENQNKFFFSLACITIWNNIVVNLHRHCRKYKQKNHHESQKVFLWVTVSIKTATLKNKKYTIKKRKICVL